jgi:hypothetical protein
MLSCSPLAFRQRSDARETLSRLFPTPLDGAAALVSSPRDGAQEAMRNTRHHHHGRSLLAGLCLLVAGCTQFPELEETISPEIERQPYPILTPQDDILATANASELDEEELREELAQRGAALEDRAAAISTRPDF